MGYKYIRTKCYWFNEYQDMNAIVPTCDYYGQYGSCSCSDECEHYISEQEVESIIRKRADEKNDWIPCSERLPECEQEVLICTERKLVGKNAYIDSIITPAIYEDGTMLEVESMWNWCDMDFDEWDDTEDCGIIPMGWFENRHFNPDEVYNNPVDRKVVAWMPLPKPYREDGEEE